LIVFEVLQRWRCNSWSYVGLDLEVNFMDQF
jgi:hypothetical protein